MKDYFKSIQEEINADQPYIEQLRWITQWQLTPFYHNCKRIVDNMTDISEETRSYLYENVLPLIDCSQSFIVQMYLLTVRMIIQYPEILYDIIDDNNIPTNRIITYEEIYDYLKEFSPQNAELLIKRITTKSYIVNKLIVSYRNHDKDHFCETLYNLEEDISHFANILYLIRYSKGCKFYIDILDAIKNNKKPDDWDILDDSDIPGFFSPKSVVLHVLRTFGEVGYNCLNDYEELLDALDDNKREKFDKMMDYINDEKIFISEIANDIQGFEDAALFYTVLLGITFYYYCKLYRRVPLSDFVILKAFNEAQPTSVKNFIYYTLGLSDDPDFLVLGSLTDPNQQNTKERDDSEVLPTQQFLPDDFFDKRNRSSADESIIGRINDEYISKGVIPFCSLIDFLASEGYIDDSEENKRNLAFKLSGYYDEYDNGTITWHGETNILSVLIQKCCYSSKKWGKAKKMIELEHNLYNSSTLRKTRTTDRDFAKLFLQLYDVDLYE